MSAAETKVFGLWTSPATFCIDGFLKPLRNRPINPNMAGGVASRESVHYRETEGG